MVFFSFKKNWWKKYEQRSPREEPDLWGSTTKKNCFFLGVAPISDYLRIVTEYIHLTLKFNMRPYYWIQINVNRDPSIKYEFTRYDQNYVG